jgi:hypothetical protein
VRRSFSFWVEALSMAYEVTKQIKGRDYRYRVESRLNPETGRPATGAAGRAPRNARRHRCGNR